MGNSRVVDELRYRVSSWEKKNDIGGSFWDLIVKFCTMKQRLFDTCFGIGVARRPENLRLLAENNNPTRTLHMFE